MIVRYGTTFAGEVDRIHQESVVTKCFYIACLLFPIGSYYCLDATEDGFRGFRIKMNLKSLFSVLLFSGLLTLSVIIILIATFSHQYIYIIPGGFGIGLAFCTKKMGTLSKREKRRKQVLIDVVGMGVNPRFLYKDMGRQVLLLLEAKWWQTFSGGSAPDWRNMTSFDRLQFDQVKLLFCLALYSNNTQLAKRTWQWIEQTPEIKESKPSNNVPLTPCFIEEIKIVSSGAANPKNRQGRLIVVIVCVLILPLIMIGWVLIPLLIPPPDLSVKTIRCDATCLAFSPDGQTFAASSRDTVKLWNVNGKLLRTLSDHTDRINSIAFSPDGRIIASLSDANVMKLWSKEGALLRAISDREDPIECMAFTPDGWMIGAGSMKGIVKLWNLDGSLQLTWQDTADTENVNGILGTAVNKITFSRDSRMIATVGGILNGIKIRDLHGALLETLLGHLMGVRSFAFSPNGQLFVSGSSDKTVRLWDIAGGYHVSTFQEHDESVNSVAFAPDGKMFASGSGDKTIKLWEIKDNDASLLWTLIGHQGSVTCLTFSPDGRTIVSAAEDGTIKFWSVAKKESRY